MRRGAALALVLGVLVACRREPLPAEMTLERLVETLAPPLDAGATVDGAVREAVVVAGDRAGGGGSRDAVVAPPPVAVRFRLAVGPDSVLRFDAGMGRTERGQRDRCGVEFRVTVDGEVSFVRVPNPKARRKDRVWIPGRIDLRPWAGKTVEVSLETRAEDSHLCLAGTPAWSHVRVLREERRARQWRGAGPNLLVLLVDTLRADRLGLYGALPSPSPALERFAAGGLVFDTAIAQASWTMPSVASIFTGLHPRSHGAVGLDVHGGEDRAESGVQLADSVVTMAELAQEAGLTTFGVSTNLLITRATNLAQGFEAFVLLPFDTKTRNHVSARTVHDRFLDWLDGARDLRFFAYLHYMEPHGPYAPPRHLRQAAPAGIGSDLAEGWVRDVAVAVNEHGAAPPPPYAIDHLRRLYDGDIRSWDDEFAALLRQLYARGVLDDTLVIVLSDHGEEFLEHGCLTHGGHLYEETVHVPLVIAGAGVPAGRRRNLAQGIDLLPTVAGFLDVSAPPGLPGGDLLATRRPGTVVSEIVAGFGNSGAGRGMVALRTKRWKLIRSPAADAIELYDLVADPGEHRNVAAATPETARMSARLVRWAAAAAPPPPTVATDHGLRDRLRQLGYVD